MRYALVTPVSRKDVVLGKFVTLAIFCGAGAAAGVVVCLVAAPFLEQSLPVMQTVMVLLAAWALGMASGGTIIPLVFRFGAEKARMFMLLSLALPVGIVVLLGTLLEDGAALALTPVIALAWDGLMYLVACRMFDRKDIA